MGVDALVKKVLKEVGINEDRYNLKWASAAEAPRFVQLITDFTNRVKELGPLGQAEGLSPAEVKERLAKALELVNDKKLRVAFGNVTKALRKEGAGVTEKMIVDTVETKLNKTIYAGLS